MTMYEDSSRYAEPPLIRPRPRAGTLWAGGCAAAVVAAGVAIVGFLIVRGLLDLPVLGVAKGGEVFKPSMLAYALLAAAGALVATGLMHVLLLTTPRPRLFFGWIMALAIVVSVIVPLGLQQPWSARLATAGINVAIGLAIASLVSMTATSAMRRRA
jgi:Family of unknown function (DUF6069)